MSPPPVPPPARNSPVTTSCLVALVVLLTAVGLFVVAVGCSVALQVVNR